MRTKDINTLAQLRQVKNELKLKMKLADEEAKDSFIYSALNNLFPGKKKKQNSVSPVLDLSTTNAIRFLADQTKNKTGIGEIAKLVLSVTLAIAAPILARKVVKLVKEKI